MRDGWNGFVFAEKSQWTINMIIDQAKSFGTAGLRLPMTIDAPDRND